MFSSPFEPNPDDRKHPCASLLPGYNAVVRMQYGEEKHRQVTINICSQCGDWEYHYSANKLDEPPRVQIAEVQWNTPNWLCGSCVEVNKTFPTVLPQLLKMIYFQRVLAVEEMKKMVKEFEKKLELEEGIRMAAAEALGVSGP